MDLFDAIKGRRSCRQFENKPVEEEKLQSILDAGRWAPSVMNIQPWRFIVIKNQEVKKKVRETCEKTISFLHQESGWKWLGKYPVDFLEQAPILIAVTADPKNTGAEQFLPGRGEGYAFSCCAAVQNILLAAHAEGLAGLWYTLYDKEDLKAILQLPAEIDLLSLIVIGYASKPLKEVPRKPLNELTTVIE